MAIPFEMSKAEADAEFDRLFGLAPAWPTPSGVTRMPEDPALIRSGRDREVLPGLPPEIRMEKVFVVRPPIGPSEGDILVLPESCRLTVDPPE